MSAATDLLERTAPAAVTEPRRPSRLGRKYGGYAAGLTLAAWIVVISVRRGRTLQRLHREVMLGGAPFVGRDPGDGWDWRFGLGLVGAGLVATVIAAAVWRGWFHRARIAMIVASCSVAATGFALMLALTDRSDGVLNGARHPTEYLANLPKTPPAAQFVGTFLETINRYSVHVRGHPPGFILVLKFMAAIGLDGPWPAALLSVASTGVLVAAVLTTVWIVAGDEWLRRCAPFLVLAPYAVWQVTSADAFYAAVGAVGVAALAVGLSGRRWQAAAAGLAGGLLLGSVLYLTYLGAIFALVPLPFVVAAARCRRPGTWPAIAGAVVGASTVVVGFLVAGFWWIDGARETRTQYWLGTAQFRDWDYFKYANVAVLLVAIGPAAIVGLMRLRDRRMWLLVGAGLLAVVASHFSQYTRGEVERIWLLFFPWLVIGAGSLAARTTRHSATAWVGVQAACAICLQAALVSKW